MGTPYDREFTPTTTGAEEIVALDFPGRCELTRVSIVRVGTGAIDVDVFNRKFVGDEHAVLAITDDGDTKALITLGLDAAIMDDVRVGDLVTVAGSSVGGYNVAHRITAIAEDKRSFVTDQAYSADGTGGTVKLDIPVAEQELNRVLSNITGSDSVLTIPPGSGDKAVYVNQDPLPNANIGVKRKIYFKFAAAATYRVAISAELSVAGEG
jgi:hypothetical protein